MEIVLGMVVAGAEEVEEMREGKEMVEGEGAGGAGEMVAEEGIVAGVEMTAAEGGGEVEERGGGIGRDSREERYDNSSFRLRRL